MINFQPGNSNHAINIAYFITPHGFGHASRAAAVMNSLFERIPDVHFEIFTTVPEWFFEQSLTGEFSYQKLWTDVGLVQKTAMSEDLPKTILELSEFYPLDSEYISGLCHHILIRDCCAVLCDIAPLGIAVAKAAGLPSILIENFTWDWIYEGYAKKAPAFNAFIPYLQDLFQKATYHIQAEPACLISPDCDLIVNPISRKPRTSRSNIRKSLHTSADQKAVLITMGGIPENYQFLDHLTAEKEIQFIIPGNFKQLQFQENVVQLPHHSQFFHPDLVNACDAVIGKLGYSTIAEVFHANIPFLFTSRAAFRESIPLSQYVLECMPSQEIEEADLFEGNFLEPLKTVLMHPIKSYKTQNGADQIAEFILTKVLKNKL